MFKNLILITLLATSALIAGSDKDLAKNLNEPLLNTVEVSSGSMFSIGKNSYSSIPLNLTISRVFYDVTNTKYLNGFVEGFLRFNNAFVQNGAETRINGASLGSRYNFCGNWTPDKITPFVECAIGGVFADTKDVGVDNGLNKDTNLLISCGAGISYDITDRVFSRIGVYYDKVVNGDAISCLGPQISIGMTF